MTEKQVTDILNVLKISFPQSFHNWGQEQIIGYKALWVEMFKDDDARLVVNAVKSLISTSTSSFAPTIGQIKNKMHSLTTVNTEVSSLEAWEVVRKAISRSGWYAEEEFEKLPDDLKRLVGSASQLHNWSQMDSDTVNSVISSNFQRNYKQRAEKDKELAMLPNDVKKALQIDEKQIFKQIEG